MVDQIQRLGLSQKLDILKNHADELISEASPELQQYVAEIRQSLAMDTREQYSRDYNTIVNKFAINSSLPNEYPLGSIGSFLVKCAAIHQSFDDMPADVKVCMPECISGIRPPGTSPCQYQVWEENPANNTLTRISGDSSQPKLVFLYSRNALTSAEKSQLGNAKVYSFANSPNNKTSGSSSWLWILLLIVLVAAAIYFLKKKKQNG